MKVIRWVSYEEGVGLPEAVGGWGGFFRPGMRWPEFLEAFAVEDHPYLEALRTEIVFQGIRRGGFWHQGGEGTPVFEDGTAAQFSFRAWGDLLAAIWSQEENRDYDYAEFAWYSRVEEEERQRP